MHAVRMHMQRTSQPASMQRGQYASFLVVMKCQAIVTVYEAFSENPIFQDSQHLNPVLSLKSACSIIALARTGHGRLVNTLFRSRKSPM